MGKKEKFNTLLVTGENEEMMVYSCNRLFQQYAF